MFGFQSLKVAVCRNELHHSLYVFSSELQQFPPPRFFQAVEESSLLTRGAIGKIEESFVHIIISYSKTQLISVYYI